MSTYVDQELDFPSAPIAGDAKATVEIVGHDWLADGDWRRFTVACVTVNQDFDQVIPDAVRDYLTINGELTIKPRRLSAFYQRAAGKNGFLDFSHWGISEDHKGRNAGKPCRIYMMRTTTSGPDAQNGGTPQVMSTAERKPSGPEAISPK